jgi:mycothiol synthase
MGDAEYERPEWTPTRVRQHEGDAGALGEERRVVSVVHEPSRTVAGFTEMKLVPLEPHIGYQQDAGVLAGFRGRGLGRPVKIEMMRWLLADHPGIESVVTGNAADNTHMIAVNRDLGCQIYRRIVNVEAKIERLKSGRSA